MDDKLSYLEDTVSNCHSYIFTIKLDVYLGLIDNAYNDNGNLQGQRTPLSSQSAKKIRERMKKDFLDGSVLPAVVIGLADNEFKSESITSSSSLIEYLKIKKDHLSLIDGMQRTTAMKDAGENVLNRDIRVELWLTENVSKLIYRMLVLNTGQVPWTMKRQLEVVLNPIKTQISNVSAQLNPHTNVNGTYA